MILSKRYIRPLFYRKVHSERCSFTKKSIPSAALLPKSPFRAHSLKSGNLGMCLCWASGYCLRPASGACWGCEIWEKYSHIIVLQREDSLMSLAIPSDGRGRSGSGETQARPKDTGLMTEIYELVLYLNEKSIKSQREIWAECVISIWTIRLEFDR